MIAFAILWPMSLEMMADFVNSLAHLRFRTYFG